MSRLTAVTNHLAAENSPYLRQHVHNPVDWYPWGPEALERARKLDRPIFLSIGYSACHWCHVMERESFEDPEIARILNEHFVSIKVDREERPDVDQIYMNAVQLLTGQGGWPLSMFLTPDQRPFYGGTYFPPDDRYGRPGFKRLLRAVAEAWQARRDELVAQAAELTGHLKELGNVRREEGELEPELIRSAVRALAANFDPAHGGFGGAPKFPRAMDVRLLLRAWKRFGDDDALAMARRTLDGMARGGIYDLLGGGFHRYSTDARWLVPHFEKMLYDNALLAVAYLEAYQATGAALYRAVVEETLGYVRREMTSPEGAFYSSQDADSDGVEGKFFVWSAEEIEAVLGPDQADWFAEAYGVSREGNWEGHNVLHRARTDEQMARLRCVPESEVAARLAEARRRLFDTREHRVRPGRDEKVLASWNGLMIDAFARAAQALDDPAHAEVAARAADFVLTRMRGPDGRLRRTVTSGTEAKLNAYLEDYSFLANALVSLFEATFEARWKEAALELVKVMIDQFADPVEGGFYDTGRDHERLLTRTKDPHDGSTPSGNSMAATALLRLARLTGANEWGDRAAATLRHFSGVMASAPGAAGQMLCALDFYVGPVQEITVVGDPAAADTRRVLRAVRSGFRPNQVVALERPCASGAVVTRICQNFTCQAPLVGADALEAALR
jgi:uncharacterized protein YyaL (SSP411 family)